MCDAFIVTNTTTEDEKCYQSIMDQIEKMEVDLSKKIHCRDIESCSNNERCTINKNQQIKQIHDLVVFRRNGCHRFKGNNRRLRRNIKRKLTKN